MRYLFYWALLQHCSGGGNQVKMGRCRFDDVVNVGAVRQSREPVAPNVDCPGRDVVKRTDLANHGSDAKEFGHFAAVLTLICGGTGYNVHSLAPMFLRCGFWWNTLFRTPINTRFGFDSPGGAVIREKDWCNSPAGTWNQ
jgi:hypothetical protein